ncbi:MAG: nuclear transport factor 2 family protein [Acidobacteriota bacterium]
MKRVIALVMLITMAALLASAQNNQNRRIEEEIRRLNAQEVEGLMHNDVKTLRSIWSDDFVVTNPFNKFANKQQVLGMVASSNIAFSSYDRQIEYVHVYHDTVIVAGSETVVWAGKMPNAGQTSRLRFTSIWMKQRGRWQEVARHANIIVQP